MGVSVRQKVKKKGEPYWIFISHKGKRTSKRVGPRHVAMAVAKQISLKLVLGDFELPDEKEEQAVYCKEYGEDWLKNVVPTICKPSTTEDYERIWRLHILPAFGECDITKIKKGMIRDFLVKKLKDNYASSTVIHMKNVISGILNKAVEDEIIELNPAQQLQRLIKTTEKTVTINPLNDEELKHFLKTAEKSFSSHYPLLLLLARTGMRVGEALALRWDDLNFTDRFITVSRSYVRGEIGTPKNDKSRRVDMSEQLKNVLVRHHENMVEIYANRKKPMPEYVFVSKHGFLIDVNNWRHRVFREIIKKAGLKHFRIHDLRHTYATLRIRRGNNIDDVSKQLGHHSIKFTMDTYYHWNPGGKKSEIDELDD